jgi:hypothetical protein
MHVDGVDPAGSLGAAAVHQGVARVEPRSSSLAAGASRRVLRITMPGHHIV